MKLILTLFAVWALAGCASMARKVAPQTETLLAEHPAGLPARARVDSVEFIDQPAGECGPAALTMALHWSGRPVAIETIAPMVMTPGKNGSLPQDLVTAARREGMLALPLGSLSALVREVAAGHPVIVQENLGLSWLPRWHYAVVIGYDLEREMLTLHTGHDPASHVDLRVFERSWNLADDWALVVLPPDQLAASADEIAHLRAAAALETIGENAAAGTAYHSILKRWPDSLGALVGLGNLAFKNHDARAAIAYLREAQRAHPESEMVRHNLRVAEQAEKRPLSSD